MTHALPHGYEAGSKLSHNDWITDPRIPDPENIPQPLGFTLIVRPYPIIPNQKKKSAIINPKENEDILYMNYTSNIGRVVAIGPCCWNRAEHKKTNGDEDPAWVKVGDVITYPKNVGSRRKFKGVSYVLLNDDEINERMVDPQVFVNFSYTVDIPDDHYDKYNIKRTETKGNT